MWREGLIVIRYAFIRFGFRTEFTKGAQQKKCYIQICHVIRQENKIINGSLGSATIKGSRPVLAPREIVLTCEMQQEK